MDQINVKLGDKVRDEITGFEGVITGMASYISGCAQALVVPPVDKDGKLPESQWFDVQRLLVTRAKAVVLDNTATPGCDRAAPKR